MHKPLEALQVVTLIFSITDGHKEFIEPPPFVSCFTKDLSTKGENVLMAKVCLKAKRLSENNFTLYYT